MNTPQATTIRVACRHCGMVMTARREHAGRRAECPRCNRVIELVEAPAPEHPSGLPMPESRAAEPAPPADTVSFDCRVCQTRMTFPLKHVGRKAKCPDCHAANVIPAPEAPRAKVVPRAMREAAYRVHEGEDQPWGVDLARAAESFQRVACRVCQSMMDATADQIGESLTCPDCGAQTIVPPPPVERRAPAGIDLSESYAVDDRPPTDRPDLSKAWLTETLQGARDDDANEFRAGGRPTLPRFPLLLGVFAFVRSKGAAARWLALTAGLSAVAALAVFGGAQLGAAAFAGQVGAIAGVMVGACAGLFAAVVGLLWFGALAAHLMAIVVESSAGNRHIHAWPGTNPTDWAVDAGYLMIAVVSAAAPGGLLAAATHASWSAWGPGAMAVPLVAAVGSLALLFPVVWLSQLEESSPMAVAAPGVLLSIPRVFGSWLTLWVQSIALAGVNVYAVLATDAVYAVSPANTYALLPLTSALLVYSLALYARLIGRLAWVVAERA